MSIVSGKILLPVTMTALIMAGCASNDTNPATTIGDDAETDTAMMHTDSMASDHTRVAPTDTSALINADTTAHLTADSSKRMGTDTAAKSKAGH